MRSFNYFQPTDIRYGSGRLSEVGDAVARFGKRCLLVTVPPESAPPFPALFDRVKGYLEEADLRVEHFAGVVPNPTTGSVTAGAEMAEAFGAEVVLGVGGGSSMDTAKAIAVEATHPGTAWDYIWSSETQPTEKTLPMVAVTTTSGTGSQVTHISVVTNPDELYKSALVNKNLFPRAAIIDPELMLTKPPRLTASTGWDTFCHAFEATLHVNASPYTDLLALEAMRTLAQALPTAIEEGSNLEAREAMAWADTVAGLSFTNAGTTLPHSVGMTLASYHPTMMHGESMAVFYPEFTRYTYPYAVEQFATMGRIFDPGLEAEPDEVAAEKSCAVLDAFLKRTGLWLSLEGLGVKEEDVEWIADHSQVLRGYKVNPRVATRDEIFEMLEASYRR
jgi:alcohol dehydrogenase class IV